LQGLIIDNMNSYLQETFFLDYNKHEVSEFFKDIDINQSAKNLSVSLYTKVREAFLYDPYHLDLRQNALKASTIIQKKRAWCVEKAIILAAGARLFNIPSRLGYAIVINHIGVDRLLRYLKRDEIVFHGYVELYIDGKWVKCTPSFDSRICKLSGVPPLDWDGEHDSLFQAFVGENQFMEYLHDYGVFEDVPIQKMNKEMKLYYPHLFDEKFESKEFSFHHL
jgi:transglutaminase-like putative cysteine protease